MPYCYCEGLQMLLPAPLHPRLCLQIDVPTPGTACSSRWSLRLEIVDPNLTFTKPDSGFAPSPKQSSSLSYLSHRVQVEICHPLPSGVLP